MGNTCNCLTSKMTNAEIDVPSREEDKSKHEIEQKAIIFIQNNYTNTGKDDFNKMTSLVQNIENIVNESNFAKIKNLDFKKNLNEEEIVFKEQSCKFYLSKVNESDSNISSLSNISNDKLQSKSILLNDDKHRQPNFKNSYNSFLSNSNLKLYAKSLKNVTNELETTIKSNKLKEPYNIFITLLGKSGTGKSSIIFKLCQIPTDNYHIPTIKVEKFNHEYKLENKKFNINFIDTCGIQEYTVNEKSLIEISDFVFLVLDLTDGSSFKFIKTIMDQYQTEKLIKIIVLGNKVEICKNQDFKNQIKKFCEEKNYEYFEISAINTINISKVVKFCMEKFKEVNLI